MKIALMKTGIEQKEILDNLLEKYNYEFSQYDKIPFGGDGLYHYRYLDLYWTEEGRAAYLIYADGNLCGFALINKYPECGRPLDWSVAEFFVSYNYRRQGVGTAAMDEIFRLHRGVWQIKYHPRNTASKCFWTKIADNASGGSFELLKGSEDYYDGTEAEVLYFRNRI